MSELHVISAKKRWAKISKEKKSLMARHMAKMKWQMMSEEERRIQIKKMVRGRQKKKSV